MRVTYIQLDMHLIVLFAKFLILAKMLNNILALDIAVSPDKVDKEKKPSIRDDIELRRERVVHIPFNAVPFYLIVQPQKITAVLLLCAARRYEN